MLVDGTQVAQGRIERRLAFRLSLDGWYYVGASTEFAVVPNELREAQGA